MSRIVIALRRERGLAFAAHAETHPETAAKRV
jgi:hypothetical protein